jgi:hypothetical protein
MDKVGGETIAVIPGRAQSERATMCNCTSENLEISGLVLRTIPE